MNPENKDMEAIEMSEPAIKKAHDILNYLSSDKETVRLAELRQKAIFDEISRLEGAEEEGIKKTKFLIAKNLLDILDIDIIAQKTGLTIKEVAQLKE